MRSSLHGVVAALGLATCGASFAGEPVNNYQNSVAIRFSVINTGEMMGTLFMFAGNFDPYGTLPTDGRLLSIAANPELFTIMGTTYGGDGTSFFQLPDLVGLTPIGPSGGTAPGTVQGTPSYEVTSAELPVSLGGSGAPIQNMQPSLGVYSMIAATGMADTSPSGGGANAPYVGQVIYTAATSPSAYVFRTTTEYLATDGNFVSTSEYGALYDTIGNHYGTASDSEHFILPDLSDRAAFGDGLGSALGAQTGSNEIYLQTVNMPSQVVDGAPYSNKQAGLSMRYLICVDGFIPPSPFAGPAPGDLSEGLLGQIILYAGDGPIPDGWMLADGSLLSVAGNEFLFSVLGIAYGGNGVTNFAIPDLVNSIPIGSGGDISSGQTFGTNFTALTPSQIPEPGACALVALGVMGVFGTKRKRL